MENLPTEPGPYWWREKDGDDWVFIYVELIGADLFARSKGAHNNLCAYVDQWKRFYPVGQWQRCLRPDDLETLRAKAEAYDKGQTMWMSFDADTNEPYAVDKDVAIVTHDTWKLLGQHPQGNMPGGFIKRRVRIVEVVE